MFFKKKPRIIYNDDNVALARCPQPHTDKKITRPLDYLVDSQVDVLCWCVMEGDVASGFASKTIENQFEIFFRQFPDTADGRKLKQQALAENRDIRISLYAKEIDYLPILIDRVHKAGIQFFGSFRMNDCHHKSMPQGKFFSSDGGCYLVGEFWKKHQDYRLWEVTDAQSYYNATMDFSFEEVRNNRINAVMELAGNYEIDGIELDFCRNPYTFPPSQAWSKRKILTDLIKKIRVGLNHIAKKRGRDIGLIIRVPVMQEKLIHAGMEVEKWIKSNCMDVLVMSHLTNDYNLNIEKWKELCRQHNVLFYPSIEAGPAANAPAHNHVVPVKIEEVLKRARAMALQYHAQGVDGVYMFNYPCHLFEHNWTPSEFKKLTPVLHEAGQKKTLQGRPIQYTFWKELPLYVEPLRPAKYHQTIKFNIFADNLKNKTANIYFRQVAEPFPHATKQYVQNPIVKPGVIVYSLNNERIAEKSIRRIKQPEGKIPSGFILNRHELLKIKLPASKLIKGENILEFFMPDEPTGFDPYVYIYELVVETC